VPLLVTAGGGAACRTKAADADTAKIIEDLLTLPRIAMAPEVFAIDLNVLKAQALLAQLKREVQ
jgi:hypothetical protein